MHVIDPCPARRRSRPLAIAAGAALVAVLTSAPAAADDVLGWTTCTADSPAPWCEVGAGTRPATGTPSASPSKRPVVRAATVRECHDRSGQVVPCYDPQFGALADDGCYYKPSSPSPELVDALGGPGQGSGGWYDVVCPGLSGTGGGTVWRPGPPPGGPAAAASPETVARQALSRLDLPDLSIGVSPTGAQLVRLPTWLWIDPGHWRARSASASVPGVVVTATATPTQVVWSTGDGASVTCAGPGTPWRPGSDPAAASPTCGYVYRQGSAGSPGGVFAVTATVSWSVSWAGAGRSGSLPALTTTASTTVRVDEVQAVVVAG